MLIIRPYRPSDYLGAKKTLEEGSLYDPIWDSRKNLSKMISIDPKSIIVATDGKNIVGVQYVVAMGWEALFFRLAVGKKYRKRGIGRALIKKAEAIVKKRGVKEVSFFVTSKNRKLYKLYKSWGYSPSDTHTYKNMYKRLSPGR